MILCPIAQHGSSRVRGHARLTFVAACAIHSSGAIQWGDPTVPVGRIIQLQHQCRRCRCEAKKDGNQVKPLLHPSDLLLVPPVLDDEQVIQLQRAHVEEARRAKLHDEALRVARALVATREQRYNVSKAKRLM